MGQRTKIGWTKRTWNPWQGCRKTSKGCKFCYMFRDKARYGQDPTHIHRSSDGTFNAPIRWQRDIELGKASPDECLVFTCSWSDWFIEEADAWRDEAWSVIRRCPDLIFQVLTKRHDRIADHLPGDWGAGYPNVWLGVSVEDQPNADRRIPALLAVPAAVRFLSVEPMLGPIDLTDALYRRCRICRGLYSVAEDCRCGDCAGDGQSVDWVIVGGESGPDARPCNAGWVRSVIDQCKAAGVACFVKQLGSEPRPSHLPSDVAIRSIRHPKGEDWVEWPADLRVRDFPAAADGQHGPQPAGSELDASVRREFAPAEPLAGQMDLFADAIPPAPRPAGGEKGGRDR